MAPPRQFCARRGHGVERHGLKADAPDFYETLGVGREAKADEIQRAYRKLARTYHPDVNKDPGAERRFQEISEAYDVLSDPETRRRYDAFGAEFRQVPPDVDPDTWARARSPRRATAGGGGGEQVWMSSTFSAWTSTSTTCWAACSGWPAPGLGKGQRRRPRGGVSAVGRKCLQGGRRSITLPGPDGSRTLDVTIPAGVTNGQRIRLAGQGGQGTGGAPPGTCTWSYAWRRTPATG